MLYHQEMSFLQALGCHLLCLVGAHLDDVGIFHSSAMEDDNQCDESKQRNQQTDPIACAAIKQVVDVLVTVFAELQGMNVLVFIEISTFIAVA